MGIHIILLPILTNVIYQYNNIRKIFTTLPKKLDEEYPPDNYL